MKRLAAVLALALAAALPVTAPAKTTTTNGAASVKCASGDPVVWVNTETKVYHLQGSSYYGKTKHGQYACQSDAAKMGARPAKGEGAKGSSMSGSSMEGMPMASPSPGKKRKHAAASPNPSAT
jgi:hypothetical protein